MNKIPCISQNTEAKTLPADGCVFGRFGRLSPTAVHSDDCWFDSRLNGWSMFHPLSHIYAKTPFCCIETVANNAQNRWIVVFDWLWINMASTLNTAFSLTSVHAKWWIHCLVISSTPLLSHLTLNYDQPKRVCEGFFGIFQDNCQIWATWAFSIICICTTTFKVSIPPLNCCFRWSRVRITLIKPLLCLNSIFSHHKAMLYQHMKFRFFHCFENLQK